MFNSSRASIVKIPNDAILLPRKDVVDGWWNDKEFEEIRKSLENKLFRVEII